MGQLSQWRAATTEMPAPGKSSHWGKTAACSKCRTWRGALADPNPHHEQKHHGVERQRGQQNHDDQAQGGAWVKQSPYSCQHGTSHRNVHYVLYRFILYV